MLFSKLLFRHSDSTQTVCESYFWPLVLCFAWLTASGCQSPEFDSEGLVPVEGKVTLDRKPLGQVAILLCPESAGRTARAVSNSKGEFRFMDESGSPGVLPGSYRVVFAIVDTPGRREQQELASEYASEDTTPVTAAIDDQKRRIEFKLSSDPDKYKN